MLVNRKQDWMQYEYQEQERVRKPSKTTSTRADNSLRRQCLQLIFLLAIVAMAITIHSEFMVRSGYNLVEFKAQAAKLEKENELLRLDIAKLKSPQRIQQIATTELGMVVPKTAYYAANTSRTAVNTTSVEDKTAKPMASMLKMNKAEASSGR